MRIRLFLCARSVHNNDTRDNNNKQEMARMNENIRAQEVDGGAMCLCVRACRPNEEIILGDNHHRGQLNVSTLAVAAVAKHNAQNLSTSESGAMTPIKYTRLLSRSISPHHFFAQYFSTNSAFHLIFNGKNWT